MKTNYLLPHRYKFFGWVLFAIGIILGIIVVVNDYESNAFTINVLSLYNEGIFGNQDGFFKVIENSILDELAALAIIIGGLLVGFSKEKIEDEFIYKLRKDSIIWAIIFNYLVLIVAIIFIYSFTFFDILVFNMFTPLIVFIARFNILKARLNHD